MTAVVLKDGSSGWTRSHFHKSTDDMRRLLETALLSASIFFPVSRTPSTPRLSAVRAVALRAEYLVDPLAIDVRVPRLSWIIDAGTRAASPRARIRSRSLAPPPISPPTRADLWDSGKTPSNRQNQIEYEGVPLTSRQRAFWKVRVWDQTGEPSAWSNSASWSMGLLDPSDWRRAGLAIRAPQSTASPPPRSVVASPSRAAGSGHRLRHRARRVRAPHQRPACRRPRARARVHRLPHADAVPGVRCHHAAPRRRQCHRGAARRRMVRRRHRPGAGAHWQSAQHLRRSSAFARPARD